MLQDVLAKRRGLSLDVSTSGALAASLDRCIVSWSTVVLAYHHRWTDSIAMANTARCKDPNLPTFNTLVRIMATRCMLSAEYFCSGSIARDAFGHYGLASPIYTHFTSPIRRYADVLVHRQLSAAVSGTPLHVGLQTKSFVEKTLEVVNKRHRLAQQAARASIEFYVALAIQRREELGRAEASSKVARQVSARGSMTGATGDGVGGVGAGGGVALQQDGKVRAEAFVIRAFRNGLAVFVSQ